MKAIGYCRVSTEGQVQDGISLDAQKAKIAAWCEANNYDLSGMFVDAGLSGGRSDNRPGLQEALAQACKQKAALIVYSLSRLARSTTDAILISERLEKSGADLVSLTEKVDTTSASGRLIFKLFSVLAEFERDQVAERTKSALGHLRTQNKRISGNIPYGYDLMADGETLIPNPSEQAGIRFMLAQQAAGNGRRKIAAALTAHGFAAKSGIHWSHQAVGGILRREKLLRPIAAVVAA